MSQLPGSGWGGRGRVTLIGDVAHACQPTYGQGGNLALEHCIVLCRLLVAKDSADCYYHKARNNNGMSW
jgi:2-polyprenyl-6-methoxyphenol hydroxylase-like FAD-dependent oxidoreductase